MKAPRVRVLGEFATADGMLLALAALRERGFRGLETYSPYPVPGAEEFLGRRRSRLPWLILFGGLVGLVIAYLIQWYANAWDYPLDVGGRPAHAIPAFVLSTFEGTIFVAALTGFFGLLAFLHLPAYWHPVFEIQEFERATIDRFWVAVEGSDPHFRGEGTMELLEELGAMRTVRLESAK